MKKKRIILIVISLIFLISMNVSGIYALTQSNISSVTGKYSVGTVNIKLNQISSQETDVMPGQTLAEKLEIKNLGIESYIRAKYVVLADNEIISNNNEWVNGISSDWIKIGDYYYYKKSVKNSETVNFYNSILIPSNLSNNYQEKKITVTSTVEAIQTKNVDIDFSKEKPWGDIEIKETVDSSYSFNGKTDEDPIIVYENKDQNDFTIPNEFFKDFTLIIPGDSYEETIKIKNNSEQETEYFMNIDTDNLTENEKNLFKQIKVNLTNSKNEKIYNKTLFDLKDISLGKYKTNDEENIKINIDVPKELDNNYSTLSGKIKWTFYKNKDEKAPEVVPKKEEPKIIKEEKTENPIIENPKTGDNVVIPLIVFAFSTIGFIATIIFEIKLKNKM